MRLLMLIALACLSSAAIAENPLVDVHTNKGVITLELFEDKAPVTVANFLNYVDKDGYQGAIFHRVIPGFMIQTGGHFEDLTELEGGEPILNEADNGVKNQTGTVAMARMNEIDSAVRQFFINVSNNRFLDHSSQSCTREDEQKLAAARERGLNKPQTCKSFGYAVFGRVTEGMNVVRQIERIPTQPKGFHQNVPVQPVIIEKIERRPVAET